MLSPMRRIEMDPDRRRLVISFPYDPSLVELVRGMPERRFDRESRTWSVPADHVDLVVTTFRSHGFSLSPDVEALRSGDETPALPLEDEGTLRISEINARVRRAILDALPLPLWVAGEIAGLDRNRHKRHVYFELVEKEEGAENPRARATAVLFEQTRSRVEQKLEQAPEPFELRDGIEVRFRVRVDLYETAGAYQLIVEDVDPVHTLGKLALARQAILRTLTERGLRDLNRERPLPAVPLEVAVITSWESDAFNDLVKELEQSGYAFHLTVFDARMQGKELKSTVAAGLDHFARNARNHDVVVLTRGGGSRSDLVWFDDLDLAVAVTRHPLKVICGIGHQRDESVLDCIATSVKTPTAAAQLLVRTVAEAEEMAEGRLARVVEEARRCVLTESERLRRAGAGVARAAEARIRAARQEARHRAGLLAQEARGALRHGRVGVRTRVDRLHAAARVATRTSFERVAAAVRGLRPERMHAFFRQAAGRVNAMESRLRALDPARVLKRGFAVVRDANGRIVTGVDRVRPGDALRIDLRDGEVDAGVKRVRPKNVPQD